MRQQSTDDPPFIEYVGSSEAGIFMKEAEPNPRGIPLCIASASPKKILLPTGYTDG